ncbi:hypothetical protein IC220_04195 [Wolbachia endosymbiont of Pentalonia nigronervosa]|jgi:hypothetical protein|uniref:terpene synthase family protein n=1 Tax=Wolbachia endosymbiont of Pentalonia nigronervosa TaxID=1301914 RepID=UPI00165F8BDB|nr:terpene synthase family protein [Wolbachia endosymbiont of Pentalonia nigronervosa]MBD0391650.1 hypothetical protein [Wolbachia endosymbiont of Pentalonia nigronervosa]
MKSYELGSQLNYQVGRELNHPESFGKDIALKFDAGEVESGKYGKAKVQGHFLLVNRYGEFPPVSVEQVKELANDWISEIGDNWIGEIELEEYCTVSEKCNIPGVVSYGAPGVAPEDLKLSFYFNVAAFLLDDAICKFKNLNKDNPNLHLKVIQQVVEAIAFIIKEYGEKDITVSQYTTLDPIFKTSCVAFSETCKQALGKTDVHYFMQELVNYVRANKWEEEYLNTPDRYRDIPYTKDDFLFLRSFDVGVSPVIEAVSLSLGTILSAEIRGHPFFQRYYRQMVSTLPGIHNDVLSLRKEIVDDEKMNFVLVECRKHSFQESIDKVVKKINNRVIKIREAELKLTSYFPNNPDLEKFIKNIEYMIDGLLYWHCTSPRYGDIKFECYTVEHKPGTFLEQPLLTNRESMKEAAYLGG